MASADHLDDQLWGTVPVKCVLAGADAKDDALHEVNFVAPRQGYLLNSIDVIRTGFAGNVKQELGIWLSVNDKPVPWHHPLTAILDALAVSAGTDVEGILPLRVTAHFTGASNDVLAFADARVGRLVVFERIKASCALRFGSPAAVRKLREERRAEFDALSRGILNNEHRVYTAAKRRLLVAALSDSAQPDKEAVLPIVLHTPKGDCCRGVRTSKRSLGTLLKELFPNQLCGLSNDDCYSDFALPPQCGRVLIQGVSPFLSTPIDALFELFAAVDGFLHIAVAV